MKLKYFISITAFELLLICCSCTDTTKYDKCYEYEEHILMVRGATCSKQLDTKCILVSNLLNDLGQPEITIKMSGLPELLKNEDKDALEIKYIMENNFRSYLVYLREEERDINQWRSSEAFLDLDILIYRYSDGPRVFIGGWLWDEDTGLTQPFYFITDGIKVLDVKRVLRPKHIP